MKWLKRPDEIFFNPGRTTLHIVLDKQQGIDYLSRFPVAGRFFVNRLSGIAGSYKTKIIGLI